MTIATLNNHRTQLFQRSNLNFILRVANWPYQINSVFNPGATLLADGTTLLLCRIEDRRGLSHLCAARSANGIDNWIIDSEPTFISDPEHYPEELWGIEDPRITYVPEMEQYAIVYTAYASGGPGVALAFTKDFISFERYGVIMQPEDKDAALLPRRIDGRWALVHRPVGPTSAHIWISYSADLRNWGGHKKILEARLGGWWDANKIGLSPPWIETSEGWLMIYHGVKHNSSGPIYRLGLALFDLNEPEHCLKRSNEWFFGPEEPYELHGDVDKVVFPGGYTLAPDGDTLRIYYGAADSSIAMATGSVKAMLMWLQGDAQSTN